MKIEKATLKARDIKQLSLLLKERADKFKKDKLSQITSENNFRSLHGLEPLDDDLDDEEGSEDYSDPRFDSILQETANILVDFANNSIAK